MSFLIVNYFFSDHSKLCKGISILELMKKKVVYFLILKPNEIDNSSKRIFLTVRDFTE